jgi:hypothetical protein
MVTSMVIFVVHAIYVLPAPNLASDQRAATAASQRAETF